MPSAVRQTHFDVVIVDEKIYFTIKAQQIIRL